MTGDESSVFKSGIWKLTNTKNISKDPKKNLSTQNNGYYCEKYAFVTVHARQKVGENGMMVCKFPIDYDNVPHRSEASQTLPQDPVEAVNGGKMN